MTTTTPTENHRVTSDPPDPIGDDGRPFDWLACGSIIVQAVAVLALLVWFLIEAARQFL